MVSTAKPEEVLQSVADWFAGTPLRITGIILIAILLVLIIRRVITRAVRHYVAAADHRLPGLRGNGTRAGVEATRREQRAQAVGSLLRSFVTVFASGVALLMILPLLGIDITPLLASAGVVGVALGFGAQNLVKDYLAGIFIVLEDQYGVGDLVEISGVIGEVEEVTLRVTRVHDQDGAVWYLRNGEILTVANRSQGWGMATADMPVDSDADLSAVRAAVADVAGDMKADGELAPALITKPSYVGVESVTGEAMVIRVSARVTATQQGKVTRELRERLKTAFDAAGIKIPAAPDQAATPAGANRPAAKPGSARRG